MDRYHESTTIVSEDATQRLVDEHKARVWRNTPSPASPATTSASTH